MRLTILKTEVNFLRPLSLRLENKVISKIINIVEPHQKE